MSILKNGASCVKDHLDSGSQFKFCYASYEYAYEDEKKVEICSDAENGWLIINLLLASEGMSIHYKVFGSRLKDSTIDFYLYYE